MFHWYIISETKIYRYLNHVAFSQAMEFRPTWAAELICQVAVFHIWRTFHAPGEHSTSFLCVHPTKLQVMCLKLRRISAGHRLKQDEVLQSMRVVLPAWCLRMSQIPIGTTYTNITEVCLKSRIWFDVHGVWRVRRVCVRVSTCVRVSLCPSWRLPNESAIHMPAGCVNLAAGGAILILRFLTSFVYFTPNTGFSC